jgi:putative ABC transport system ATP-binding protein
MISRPAKALISATGLTRIYSLGSTEIIGVQDIHLEISKGELVVLRGVSGSGKSTLLALLGGLDQPTRGRLTVDGHDLQKSNPEQLNEYRRTTVGMIFQSFNLLPTLTVMENICLPALLAGKPYGPTRKRALDWLDWLHLTHRVDHYPSQLSGGEMQRTAIIRALINEPAIILADEPTGNLDSANGRSVMELLAELNRTFARTIIIATHSSLADPFATFRICLKDGRIAEAAACNV